MPKPVIADGKYKLTYSQTQNKRKPRRGYAPTCDAVCMCTAAEFAKAIADRERDFGSGLTYVLKASLFHLPSF